MNDKHIVLQFRVNKRKYSREIQNTVISAYFAIDSNDKRFSDRNSNNFAEKLHENVLEPLSGTKSFATLAYSIRMTKYKKTRPFSLDALPPSPPRHPPLSIFLSSYLHVRTHSTIYHSQNPLLNTRHFAARSLPQIQI